MEVVFVIEDVSGVLNGEGVLDGLLVEVLVEGVLGIEGDFGVDGVLDVSFIEFVLFVFEGEIEDNVEVVFVEEDIFEVVLML